MEAIAQPKDKKASFVAQKMAYYLKENKVSYGYKFLSREDQFYMLKDHSNP